MPARGRAAAPGERGRALLVVLALLIASAIGIRWATRPGGAGPPHSLDAATVEMAPAPPMPVTAAPVAPASVAVAPAPLDAAPFDAAPLPVVDTTAPAGFGEVTGSVFFVGAPPVLPPIQRRMDAYCGRTPVERDESLTVNSDGALRDVLVRIEGAPDAPPASPAVEIDQENCAYRPRVVGIVAGQRIEIVNRDQTLHNVHAFRRASSWFNQAELAGSAPIAKLPAVDELIKLKCDVHPWMTGWVRVQNNALFAITDEHGAFSIPGVPAGRHPIVAWQERYGERRGEVTVVADRVSAVKLDYRDP